MVFSHFPSRRQGESRTLSEKQGPTKILLGRKAGTDRGTATPVAVEGIPVGFHPGDSGRVALKAGERERQRRVLMLRGTSCISSRCRRGKDRCDRLYGRGGERFARLPAHRHG